MWLYGAAPKCASRFSTVSNFGSVVVGAVVVAGGEVIAKGHNRSETDKDPSAHAEIQALRAAARAVGNYRLPGTLLYVTLEPCPMCAAACRQARAELLEARQAARLRA